MKKIICCIIACVMLLSLGVSVSAAVDYPVDLPYESYIYSQQGEPLIVPAPYASDHVLHGSDVTGWAAFKDAIVKYQAAKLVADIKALVLAKHEKDQPDADAEALYAADAAILMAAYGVQTPEEAFALYVIDEETLDEEGRNALALNTTAVDNAFSAFGTVLDEALAALSMPAVRVSIDTIVPLLVKYEMLPASVSAAQPDETMVASVEAAAAAARKAPAAYLKANLGVSAEQIAKYMIRETEWFAQLSNARSKNKFKYNEQFSDLSDIFYDGELVFLVDSGNCRVVVLDKAMTAVQNILYEVKDGPMALDGPRGVFVNDEFIYVADTGNSRIVVYDRQTFQYHHVLNKPDCAIVATPDGETGEVTDPQNYTYKPTKVTVDIAGRIYVVAESINFGLMQLDADGTFSTFIGAPKTTPTITQIILRRIMPDSMKNDILKNVPTEYNAMHIDNRGFIYCAAKTSTTNPVVKLNSNGADVLKFEHFGDEAYVAPGTNTTSKSYFADLVVSDDGFLYTLDSNQGKIYMYDESGELLFAFGTNNSQSGSFYSASSIELVDGRLYVTDTVKATVTVFEATEFGGLVKETVQTHAAGQYEKAQTMWAEIYRRSSNYQPAIIGLARIDIQNREYQSAMDRLKPIYEKHYYALAFEKWRDNLLRDNFAWVLLGIVVLAAVVMIVPKLVRKTKPFKKLAATGLYQKYKYGTYTMFHPFDGFWDIKREKRGDAKAATIILALFMVLYAVRAQFSGYVVTGTISKDVDAIFECLMVLLPLLFWVVANWCFTTLMNGEGSMKDIYTCTCYALKPYVLCSIPLFIMTHVLTAEEAMFYTVFDTIVWTWVLGLIFFGMMTTHDYSLLWGLLTAVLTIVGMLIIIFIILLFVNIVQDVVVFVYNIYKELAFRTY